MKSPPLHATAEAQASQVTVALGNNELSMLRDFIAHAIMSEQAVDDALASGDVSAAKLMLGTHDARLRVLLAGCDYELKRREKSS